VFSLSLLDLLLHRVEGFRVGSVHLLSVRLGGSQHLVEVGENLEEARWDSIGGVDLTGNETDELVEFCEKENG
jgi:hypothetical protein